MAICLKAIGRNIRTLRKETGMTQDRIAEKLGISELHYGRLERGERNVSLARLDQIAGLFGVPVWQLVRGAFPDEIPKSSGKDGCSPFAQRIEHMAQSLSEKERRIVLALCRMLAHGN